MFRSTTLYAEMDTIRVPLDVLEAHRSVSLPFQPSVKAGSVLIRDIRVWHRGTPNHVDRPRPMVATIYNIAWWSAATMVFPKGTEKFLSHPNLHSFTKLVDPSVDYLHRHEAYDVQK